MKKRILPAILAGLCVLWLSACTPRARPPPFTSARSRSSRARSRPSCPGDRRPAGRPEGLLSGRIAPDARPRRGPGQDVRDARPCPPPESGLIRDIQVEKAGARRAPPPRPAERTRPGPDPSGRPGGPSSSSTPSRGARLATSSTPRPRPSSTARPRARSC